MAGRYEVRWSGRSIKDADAIVQYLREKWTQREVENFLDKLSIFTTRVISFPESYPQSNKKKLRKAVISEQQSVIYKIKRNEIEVITIIDNRSNHHY